MSYNSKFVTKEVQIYSGILHEFLQGKGRMGVVVGWCYGCVIVLDTILMCTFAMTLDTPAIYMLVTMLSSLSNVTRRRLTMLWL